MYVWYCMYAIVYMVGVIITFHMYGMYNRYDRYGMYGIIDIYGRYGICLTEVVLLKYIGSKQEIDTIDI